MAIVKCENNHYYDNVKFDECPHCKGETLTNDAENEKTIAKIESDKLHKNLASFAVGNEERTVSIFSNKNHFSPVVGWLVCLDGKEKGRDYRIVSGRNFVGRSYKMDIAIPDDEGISRENHCSIVFDPKSVSFMFVPGSNISYYNSAEVMAPTILKRYDTITLGKTVLQFIPYCTEEVMWK